MNKEQARLRQVGIHRIFDVISTGEAASTVDPALYSMLVFVPVAFIGGFARHREQLAGGVQLLAVYAILAVAFLVLE